MLRLQIIIIMSNNFHSVTPANNYINIPAQNPLHSEVKVIQESLLMVKEDQRTFTVEFQRTGNLFQLSLIRYVTT